MALLKLVGNAALVYERMKPHIGCHQLPKCRKNGKGWWGKRGFKILVFFFSRTCGEGDYPPDADWEYLPWRWVQGAAGFQLSPIVPPQKETKKKIQSQLDCNFQPKP